MSSGDLPQTDPQQRWKSSWQDAKTRILNNTQRTALHVVPRTARVSKLDADLLDDELTEMLREPVTQAVSLLKPGFVDKWKLEIDTAIKAVLFWLSVGSHRRATYGQTLQNLTYEAQGRSLVKRIHMFGILSIGGGYAWTRLMRHLSLRGWADAPAGSLRSRIWKAVDRLERFFKVATLVNFLAFISTGQYKTVVERLLGLRLVYARPQMAHSVSFEFLNRQLVWHAFTEFVMFALPLVNPAKARAWVVRNARAVLRLPGASVDPVVAALPDHICPICFTQTDEAQQQQPQQGGTGDANHVVNPYVTPCGHVYCYVCIQTKIMTEGDECCCLRCGSQVKQVCQYVEQ
ncbi:peroxisome assembly protein (Peroxin-2) [Linderina macrospora]|uniref:Peroxisome assembly protein (Peroxin-2) n=1 Tax=Linderina macrospora TaxID=4868 RepID=A0ACC1J2B4_9FUNG|nr:peroxisome assembly protein (Peroxin-2) [Linderina macrospora]